MHPTLPPLLAEAVKLAKIDGETDSDFGRRAIASLCQQRLGLTDIPPEWLATPPVGRPRKAKFENSDGIRIDAGRQT